MNKNLTKARIKVPNKEVISAIEEAVSICYGILEINYSLNKKGKKEERIVIVPVNKGINVSIYLNVADNVKITETIVSAQSTILFYLNKKWPNYVQKLNVYAELIRPSK